MVFNVWEKEKKRFSPLTEDDIRSRLYGSAVGSSIGISEHDQTEKRDNKRRTSPASKDQSDEMSRIHDELAALRSELDQAKRRLKKIRWISIKKLRVVLTYILVCFIILYFLMLVLKNTFSLKKSDPPAGIGLPSQSAALSLYTIQVAVSERYADAERFKIALEAKGFNPFIRKFSSAAGKERFIIYTGGFQDRAQANRVLNRLKTEEAIADAFIVNMPE